jgi:two-component system sensor histidine kinase TtrS
MFHCRYLWLCLLAVLASPLSALADGGKLVRIGVLSHRGDQFTLDKWSPPAEYLTSQIADHHFIIVPLDFAEVETAVVEGKVDFVLVNSGIYVNLEVQFRVSRIATLNNRRSDVPYNIFGGVIFTRADNPRINSLEDLPGHSLMAVDATSLGGFQMAWREMRAQGIDINDLSELRFAGIHDRVVMAVRSAEVDAGTVRTDILERMASAGMIDLDEFRIINPQSDPEFPFAHSTRLYPEWPFSKVAHTSNALAQRVAVALLNMPQNHPAAIQGRYSGWTIPLDYQRVRELLKELHLRPFEKPAQFTLLDAIKRYWYWLLSGLIFLIFMALMTLWVLRLNRELQRAKSRLEQQHELILDSVADGIYGVDLHGNCTFFSRAAEAITGWSAEDLIGLNQHEILHHTHPDGTPHPAENCPVYQTFRDNQPRFVSDDAFWHKAGHSIPVEYSCTPVKDESERTLGSVVVFRDITKRKQAEDEARQHQNELARVARFSTMGEMASGIAHELNQPLTAIATNAHASIRLLESGKEGQQACADVMERIASQAERAGAIIRQLRRFVRKEPLERSRVDINTLVDAVAVLIQPEARRADVAVRLELMPNPPQMRVQRIQVEQVILNLARNAIESMAGDETERQLVITTEANGVASVQVRVSDTGPGIKLEMIETLFAPFVTSKSGGMGLGLSISHGIVEAHGGRLSAQNLPQGGACFIFTLPVSATT